ncbi:MAG TPA: hypothetical protein VF240_15625 [Pyrinomonadaceae bacterium]
MEFAACTPRPVSPDGFNPEAVLPFGLTAAHVHHAMDDFIRLMHVANVQLHGKQIQRLETILAPANFSGMVGDFMAATIPNYCDGLARNMFHNGHPDMIPKGRFPDDSVQYAHEGIEIKASRYLAGWQGHNPENAWLMVFVFGSNRPADALKGMAPRPFEFQMVVGAQITEADWGVAGRREGGRRTPTAGVLRTGREKMMANWIYKAPDLTRKEEATLLAAPPPS